MNKFQSKNDIAWANIFKKYKIVDHVSEHGQFIISAEEIRVFREPRLMAKIDHKSNLPEVFSKNKLSILPISRGTYVISNFKAYKKHKNTCSNITKAQLPSHLQSLDIRIINSETVAINCASASGILGDFFDDYEYAPTVSGRMGSGKFDFDIETYQQKVVRQVAVNSAQIEVDAAFETADSLFLLEAKLDVSDDFLVRQLYYPYRTWLNRVTKKVRPVFLIYTNGIFNLYEYEFSKPTCYNSLKLIKHKVYSIEDIEISWDDVNDVICKTNVVNEPLVPFPQADSFGRVVNLCEVLSVQECSLDEITSTYDFARRQSGYYTNAAIYLGLVVKKGRGKHAAFTLTKKAEKILKLSYKEKQLAFCSLILQHAVFRNVFYETISSGKIPDKREIKLQMEESSLYKIGSENTYNRRASTINGWIKWIVDLVAIES